MYCSEHCLNADWSFAHNGECNNKLILRLPHPLLPFNLEEYTKPGSMSRIVSFQSILLRLVATIGLDEIKNIVGENKSMPSLLGDPRKKGFQNGKFEAATLEALLSLEDTFGKLSDVEVNAYSKVSS
jgi:hypothetical protein